MDNSHLKTNSENTFDNDMDNSIENELSEIADELEKDERDQLKKYSEKLFEVVTKIYRAGLIHWFYKDLDIYEFLSKNETEKDFKEILKKEFSKIKSGKFLLKGNPLLYKTQTLLRYANSGFPIIIIGESGTGKELIANIIHEIGPRKGHPFISINASALTETLFESEMFGHVKGAFTGAMAGKIGLIEQANKGTLFLDELGKMPKPFQAKLLRVIESKKIRKVGSNINVKKDINIDVNVDVNFIVALHQSEIDQGNVIYDLLYRLKYPAAIYLESLNDVLPFHGERIINSIKDRLIKELTKSKLDKNDPAYVDHSSLECEIYIDDDLMNYLLNRNYKGNYRELENILYQAIMNRDFQHDTLTLRSIAELSKEDSDNVVRKDRNILSLKLSTIAQEQEQIENLFRDNRNLLLELKLDYENIVGENIFDIGNIFKRSFAIGMIKYLVDKNINIKTYFNRKNEISKYQTYLKRLEKLLGMKYSDYVKTKYEK